MKCPNCKMNVDVKCGLGNQEDYYYCGQCQYSFGVASTERKIKQIAAIEAHDEDGATIGIFALCNDGTLWQKWGMGRWGNVDPIPQDGEEA